MKRIVKIYNKLVLVAIAAVAGISSSCTDYLTIIPPDVVVQENFWHTKDEVNGMLATSYIKLISTDAIQKAIVWGELRADNMTYPASYNRDIKYIVEASILDDNSFCRWGIFYEQMLLAGKNIEGRGSQYQLAAILAYESVRQRDEFWPIPAREMSVNPYLTQNTGW